jgi:aryl-alcohol dehydrogenase-like predicted oxidoreductase
MQYREVGNSGLTVSAVALGCTSFGGGPVENRTGHIWGPLGVDEGREVVDAAIDAGITFFDLADIHADGHAEQVFGEVIKGRRTEVVIATKGGGGEVRDRADVANASRRYLRRSVEASLRRLQTDYIDLYQLHWQDPRTPIEETLRALDELVAEGKIRYIGSSHLSAWEVADADWIARSSGSARFVSAQNHYNLLQRDVERELIPACERFGVGLLPYFPLGKGLLTGKYRRDQPRAAYDWMSNRVIDREIDESVFDTLEALEAFAQERGHTLPDLAVAALLTQPVVASVLTGASSAEQIRASAAAADWELSPGDRDELRTLLA